MWQQKSGLSKIKTRLMAAQITTWSKPSITLDCRKLPGTFTKQTTGLSIIASQANNRMEHRNLMQPGAFNTHKQDHVQLNSESRLCVKNVMQSWSIRSSQHRKCDV